MTVRLEEWTIDRHIRHLVGPCPLLLRGYAFGHGRQPSGAIVVTTPVVRVEGRRAWTRSGTEYELGAPGRHFFTLLESVKRTYNPEAPLEGIALE